MTPRLSRRSEGLRPSPTMSEGARTSRRDDVISLAVGELRRSPPLAAIGAAEAFVRAGDYRYGPPAGLDRLRDAIAVDQTSRQGRVVRPADVVVTHGGKLALFESLRAVLDPGSEALIFAPYWPTFVEQVEMLDGRAVVVPANDDGTADVIGARSHVGDRTRAIIVNTPNNPTSMIWSTDELQSLAKLAVDIDAWIICDQVYDALDIDGRSVPLLAAAPDVCDRTIVIESVSKRFAMPALRLGAAIAPPPIVEAIVASTTSTTTHANAPAQHAALAALEHGDAWCRDVRDMLRTNRDVLLTALESVSDVRCVPPESLFCFLDVRSRSTSSETVCERLRDEVGVHVTPGTPFGAPGFVRLSMGVPTEDMVEASTRLRRFFAL